MRHQIDISLKVAGKPASILLAALLLATCSSRGGGAPNGTVVPPSPSASSLGVGDLTRCEDVPPIQAPEEAYRDHPIYVANEMHVEAIQQWARQQPAYEGIWIDREHNGWVTVAFSRDAAARQADLEREFPDDGVVAVQVDWTMAELEALQHRVMTEGAPDVVSSGIPTNLGVVSVGVAVLYPDVVRRIASKFGDERICIGGADPSVVPPEGPQPQVGDGWRLLADEDMVGAPYRTGVAADTLGYAALWDEIGLDGEPPLVDFESEVAVWFGAVHGSSCPRLRLDDVVADVERELLHAVIATWEFGACTADAVGHAYVVAVDRSILPPGGFTIQLGPDDPPSGVIDQERTVVGEDLTVPGSTLGPSGAQSPPATGQGPPRVQAGGVIDPEVVWAYRLDVRCGIEWLGELNGVTWRNGEGDRDVPQGWTDAVEPDGSIALEIVLTVDPPRIRATAAGHTRTYRPSPEEAPPCR
jgi:hypothetical protein